MKQWDYNAHISSLRNLILVAIGDLLDARVNKQKVVILKSTVDAETFKRRCEMADRDIQERTAIIRRLYATRHFKGYSFPALIDGEPGSNDGMTAQR